MLTVNNVAQFSIVIARVNRFIFFIHGEEPKVDGTVVLTMRW